MKLASFTDNSQSFLKYGDTNTFLHVQISEDGTFVDLTQALAVNVPVANDDGLLFTKTIDPTKLANGDSGIVDINFTSDDQNNLPPDDYYLEIWVTNHDGTIGIYPADENQLMFTITDNLTLITGDVVPAVAFDDFQNMFNTLQQQVHDAIANGLKGEAGAKGDPGEGLDIKGRVDSVSELPTTASEGDGYLVNEELYVYTSGAWKDCGQIQGPQGIQGIQGKTGTGVSSTTIQYQIANSATTTPTGTWSNSLIATTQVNPFLWTQVTLSYDDGTSKSFYLVSSKGDKGDKGDTGATGPVGPVGPVGAGLVVKGTVKDASQLPKDGNQEGYCYFVGTNLYVWDAGAWKNCGSVSPDLSKYVTVTDLNNGLSTKQDKLGYTPADDSKVVHDNHDGTEQLNGVQVQPYNKLSDTIGGRNLWAVSQSGFGYFSLASKSLVTTQSGDFNKYRKDMIATNGAKYISVRHTGDLPSNLLPGDGGRIVAFDKYQKFISVILKPTEDADYFAVAEIPENTAYVLLNIVWGDSGETMIQFGNQKTDWTPAPEDKVNVADMRKPASDVAGLEDVPTAINRGVLANGTDMNTVTQEGIYILGGHSFVNFIDTGVHWGILQVTNQNAIVIQTAKCSSNIGDIIIIRTQSGEPETWYSWNFVLRIRLDGKMMMPDGRTITPADDSKVAHLSGANNFDTIPTVNNTPLLTSDKLPDNIVKQGDVIGNIDYIMQNRYSMSDGKLDITTGGVVSDPSASYKTTGFVYINSLIKNFTIVNSSAISKDALIVAFYDNTMKFISGVSFDGTTVNQKIINVPSNTGIIKFSIVYASVDSISMYAGSNIIDTNNWPSYSGISLGGKQGATIDDVTNAVNTATANSVSTNKLANFTAGLQSGGVDVATAADLKSIEDSAWRQLDNKYVQTVTGATVSPNTTILYKVDDVNKKLYLQGSILLTNALSVNATVNLNSIVKTVTGGYVRYLGSDYGYANWTGMHVDTITPTSIVFSLNSGTAGIVNDIGNGSLSYITYDELV